MSFSINGFRITGLHGHRDVNIAIDDNCVVLVGVNGLGKTTIINILYYLLTRQWSRLLEYKFDTLTLDVDERTLTVTRSQLEAPFNNDNEQLGSWKARFNSRYMPYLRARPELLSALATISDDPVQLRELAESSQLPYSMLREARNLLEEEPFKQELFQHSQELETLEDELGKIFNGQVLYLPTYRRIERDFGKIFPGLDEQVQRQRQRTHRLPRQSAYLEFVEFGMKDVERRFTEVLTGLKERARSELNNLAASYLGEVIRGQADTYDTSLISSLDDLTITNILNRLEERDVLEAVDGERLRTVISRLKASNTEITAQEKYVGHFFSKLAVIHKSLAEAEAVVESFVTVCNRYLVGKEVVFDDRKYMITIQPQSSESNALELRHLSSGEKQIVSLFTHVYLGEASEFMVLIDEPELSLSVPWQKQLLPDIRNSGRCTFLAAVTHSPFIYDNSLSERATDLQQCINER